MKRVIISLFVFLLSSNAFAFIPEIKTIPLNDGEVIEARLCLPDNKVKTIVLISGGDNTVSFKNTRAKDLWLDGNACKDNVFNS